MKLGALGALGALAALPLLVVMTGPTEGRKISAWDLKVELQKLVPRSDPSWIARVASHAETLSGLDTTLVRKCPRANVATLSRSANVISVQGGRMETLELRGEQMTDDPLPEEDDDLEEEEQEEGDYGDEDGEDGKDRRTLLKHQKKYKKKPRRCWPGTSYYGIFQLLDRLHCDSGENPTLNLCRTSCSAFTDDDVTDDIRCILQTGYWRRAKGRPKGRPKGWANVPFKRPRKCKGFRCP